MLSNNTRMFKPTHFIGLGGAGCNALEFIHQQGVAAEFTCISDRKNLHLPENFRFIPFIRDRKRDVFDGSKLFFARNCRYILLAGLGGNTGSYLVEELTQQLLGQNIQFLTICSHPFALEGKQRSMTAERIIARFSSTTNFICFDLNLLIRGWGGDLTISSAFEKADQQFYWLSQGLQFN
jgi:cell division GTPase FtsZ